MPDSEKRPCPATEDLGGDPFECDLEEGHEGPHVCDCSYHNGPYRKVIWSDKPLP